MDIVQVQKRDELWEELHDSLQRGLPDVGSLQRTYNYLTKFMSICMVEIQSISEHLDLEPEVAEYEKDIRNMTLQGMHYNERRLLRHLKLPPKMRALVRNRDGLNQQLEMCKDIQRILKDRLEVFKLEYQLSGGNYQ